MERPHFLLINEKESFDMWRLYGDNGRRVALVFKFSPDFEEWKNSFICNIYYKKQEKLDVFDDLVKLHNEFHQTHEILIKENFFGKQNEIPSWISIFLAFHKTSLYKYENEVRVLKFDFNGLVPCVRNFFYLTIPLSFFLTS